MNRLVSGARRRVRLAAMGLTGVVLCASTAPPSAHAQVGSDGKRLFETICVACHTIGAGVRIGPDLQGVAERRSTEWLRRQIRDPEALRKAGDSVSIANRAKYRVSMPALGLTEQQVEAVIAHLGAAPAAPPARPWLHVPTLVLAGLAAALITFVALNAATSRAEIRA